MAGGGQEFGLRPGTLPTELIVGLGKAAELALAESSPRAAKCMGFKTRALQALAPLKPVFNGDQTRTLPHVFNISFQGLDSEAVMVALKDWVAISNGSACTSTSYELSHVLKAMELPEKRIKGALRFSWCHMSSDPDWSEIIKQIKRLS
jgi:cysteine desulfurase